MKSYNEVVDSYESSKDKVRFIKNFIYNKKFRDCSIQSQKIFLRFIIEETEQELAVLLNARIAYAHKSMESLSFDDVNYALTLIRENIDLSTDLENTDYIRTDKKHILFSSLSVLFHLLYFKSDFMEIPYYCNLSLQKFKIERSYTSAFYQTCTNVSRVMSFGLISFYREGNLSKSKECLNLIKNSFQAGVINSDQDPVKFLEFLEATQMYHCARKVVEGGDDSDRLLEDLFLVSIRPHGYDKVNTLLANFRGYIRCF